MLQFSSAVSKVPQQIIDYVKANLKYPVALIGCHAVDNCSFSCCEYDLAAFTQDDKNNNNQIYKIGDRDVRIIYFSKVTGDDLISLTDIIPVYDNNMVISSFIQGISREKYKNILKSHGKKLLIKSLICNEKADGAVSPLISAMWLKMAAYNFLEGILYTSLTRPMPTHELDQVRKITPTSQSLSTGIQVALESIGIERATRPTLTRSAEASLEIISDSYDRDLISLKSKYLIENGMLSDSYYYIGKKVSRVLEKKEEQYYKKYIKLIQISMDLLNDQVTIQKLQTQLFKACNDALKS